MKLRLFKQIFTFKKSFFYALLFSISFLLSYALNYSKKPLYNSIVAQTFLNSPIQIEPQKIKYSLFPLGIKFYNVLVEPDYKLKKTLSMSEAKKIGIFVNPFYLLFGEIKASLVTLDGADIYYKIPSTKGSLSDKPNINIEDILNIPCLLYTSPSPRDATLSRMPSSA